MSNIGQWTTNITSNTASNPSYPNFDHPMSGYIGLDFETYSACDLLTHGLARYVQDKSFKVLLAGLYEVNPQGTPRKYMIDFVDNADPEALIQLINGKLIIAHNAGFERAVLAAIGIDLPAAQFIDSAVVARVAGAASHLEAAAPQLLGLDKMEMGKSLIRLFSIPGKYQEENNNGWFDPQVVRDNVVEWAQFKNYCLLDAELGFKIVESSIYTLTSVELDYQALTMEMNSTGWRVDIDVVREMQRRYLENQADVLARFRNQHNAKDLNLNSLPQLKKWCADRGVRASSFDEKNVASLLGRLTKKIESLPMEDPKLTGYNGVYDLLITKQILGGSSLKKLQVILDTAVEMKPGEWRLKDQYMHCGAGQTLRTSGRSVQMQNLKRLSIPTDMDTLFDPSFHWSNEDLASNLRQVFTATHPQGRLIVGDFSSVESRGLAYLAGEEWKLEAFLQGQDLYKVLAAKIDGTTVDQVTKERRQFGKVGELSCGYQAGPGAVRNFAEKMGTTLTDAEATSLVYDWREANQQIVYLWAQLDHALREAVSSGHLEAVFLDHVLELRIYPKPVPASLRKQLGMLSRNEVSLYLELRGVQHQVLLKRVFHGVHERGNSLCYFKPSERKTGDLWLDEYTDPKTKQRRNYTIYGGKLAGILTQSLCRELFFDRLTQVQSWVDIHDTMQVVGQFHDEIVVDWSPGGISLDNAEAELTSIMSDPGFLTSFPLSAEVKSDYRYTK